MNKTKSRHKRHLLVAVSQGGDLKTHALIDVRRNSGPLLRELGFRALGAHPELAGLPFDVDLWADPPRGIELEAHLTDAVSKNGPLARISIPTTGCQPVAQALARRAKIEEPFQYHVLPCAEDSQAVRNWAAITEDEEIAWEEDEEEFPRLPTGHRFESPGPTRVIDRAATWLRCVFHEAAYREFLAAAAAETKRERAWVGIGEVVPGPDRCLVVVKEIVELPAETAGETYLRTTGREVSRLLTELGPDRILAHLHLHPREVEGKAMSPNPSSEDESLAWDFSSQLSRMPCCFPIALFGVNVENPEGELAVHGYENGILSRIQLEVTV